MNMNGFALDKSKIISSKGLLLSQLMRNTERFRKHRADDIVIKSLKKGKTAKGRSVIFALMSSAADKTKVYKTWITIMEEGQSKIPPNCKVQVQCTCHDYLFRWEYANAAYRAARIVMGNGEAPDETNPVLEYGLCKHLYQLAHHLLPNER